MQLSRVLRRHSAPLLGAWRGCLAVLVAGLLGGCGTLPSAPDRPRSAALAPQADSELVRIAQASTPAPELSGFRLMPLGLFSLDARVQLIQRARHAVDVQYYVFDDDPSGRLLLLNLHDAAARGVRVRLLVDDLYTTATHELLRAFADEPNVEVRLFNPFCCARGGGLATRFAASVLDLGRLNHRMHNKLLVADGAFAVAGGRNVADDYFMRGSLANFVDMDALITGAVVRELSGIFDSYWNSPVVYPVQAVEPAPADAAALHRLLEQTLDMARQAPPLRLPSTDVLGYGPVGEELDGGRIGLVWGTAMAVADPPDKLTRASDAAYADSLAYQALMRIWTADSEVVLTSPYMIPGPLGIKSFEDLQRRKVKITVLTNSLAATDEPLVHTGYSRYRERLLDAGVDLYELSPTRAQRNKRLGMFGSSVGRLHAKTAVVDRRDVFLGSMNLDPRSRTQNTELGVFVRSPQLAKELLRVVNISKLQSAYRVRRDPAGPGLQWLTLDDEGEVILGEEPESTWWMRVHNFFFGFLVPEELL